MSRYNLRDRNKHTEDTVVYQDCSLDRCLKTIKKSAGAIYFSNSHLYIPNPFFKNCKYYATYKNVALYWRRLLFYSIDVAQSFIKYVDKPPELTKCNRRNALYKYSCKANSRCPFSLLLVPMENSLECQEDPSSHLIYRIKSYVPHDHSKSFYESKGEELSKVGKLSAAITGIKNKINTAKEHQCRCAEERRRKAYILNILQTKLKRTQDRLKKLTGNAAEAQPVKSDEDVKYEQTLAKLPDQANRAHPKWSQ